MGFHSARSFGRMRESGHVCHNGISAFKGKRAVYGKEYLYAVFLYHLSHQRGAGSDLSGGGQAGVKGFAVGVGSAGSPSGWEYDHFDELMDEADRILNLVRQYLGKEIVKKEEKSIIKDKTILVVDDSEVISSFIKKLFNNEYNVLLAKDGMEAINNLNNESLVGMLLDLNMPNVNGFVVLEYMKNNDLFKTIPVSIITGVGNDDIIKKAFEYPVVDVLRKPFNERDIRKVVETYTAKDAKSAIAAVVRADKASNKVEVEAKIKIAEGGSYRVAAWLLEDGILDNSQQNYTDLTDDFSTHNNVLRQSSASLAFGDKLGDSLPAGSTEDYSCSFTLSSEKMDNCRVVIMVTAPEGGVFAVDNVVMCPLNDKVGFEYK